MRIKTQTLSYESRAKIFGILSSIFVVSLCFYIYGVLATINHTIAKENLVKKSSELTSRVSELEYEDIALRNTINLEAALSRGFTEVKNPIYVSRSKSTLTLNIE